MFYVLKNKQKKLFYNLTAPSKWHYKLNSYYTIYNYVKLFLKLSIVQRATDALYKDVKASTHH